MNYNFANNLKRLRIQKKYTQEQVAQMLNVSPKSISRWECGSTTPDIIMLPEIANLYCVTIDDLYKDEPIAYETYAHRLMSVYESTHNIDDFIRAEKEYTSLLERGKYTMKDVCMYAMLYQFHTQDSIDKAMQLFRKGLDMGIDNDPDTYHWIERQKILMLAQIGENEKSIAEQTEKYNNNPNDLYNCINLIVSLLFAGNSDKALEIFIEAEKKFGDAPILYIYGGLVYKNLKKYDHAFACWDKSLQIDTGFTAAMRAKAECYEELGEYQNALNEWTAMIDWYSARGYEIEADRCRQHIKSCMNKVNGI